MWFLAYGGVNSLSNPIMVVKWIWVWYLYGLSNVSKTLKKILCVEMILLERNYFGL